MSYIQLSRNFHPDRNPDLDTTALFQMIKKAYDVLSNPTERATYDREGGQNENNAPAANQDNDDDDYDDENDEALGVGSRLSMGDRPSKVFRDLYATFQEEVLASRQDPRRESVTPVSSADLAPVMSHLTQGINQKIEASTGTKILPRDRAKPCPLCIGGGQHSNALYSATALAAHFDTTHSAYQERIFAISQALAPKTKATELFYSSTAPLLLPRREDVALDSVAAALLPSRAALHALGRDIAANGAASADKSALAVEGDKSTQAAVWLAFLDSIPNESALKAMLAQIRADVKKLTRGSADLPDAPVGEALDMSSVPAIVPIYKASQGPKTTQSARLTVPSIQSVRVAPTWQRAASCTVCNTTFGWFSGGHHCRACGKTHCNACLPERRTLPQLGAVGVTHRVCKLCCRAADEADVTALLRSACSLSAGAKVSVSHARDVLLMVMALGSDGTQRLPWAEVRKESLAWPVASMLFSATTTANAQWSHNLRTFATAEEKHASDNLAHFWLSQQRDLWFNAAIDNITSTTSVNLKDACVCLNMLELLHTGDSEVERGDIWIRAAAAYLRRPDAENFRLPAFVCLLKHTRGQWTEVANWLFAADLFGLSFVARQIMTPTFDVAAFWTRFAADADTPEEKIVCLASALLVQETPALVVELAAELAGRRYFDWAVEILCVTYSSQWRTAAPRVLVLGHKTLLQCFENLTEAEHPAVLAAGTQLLAGLIDGAGAREYVQKSRVLSEALSARKRSDEQAALLPFKLAISDPEALAALLLQAYKKQSLFALKAFHTHLECTLGAYAANLPRHMRAILLAPSALVDMIDGDVMRGVPKLYELLHLGAAVSGFCKLAAEVLTDPLTRAAFLTGLHYSATTVPVTSLPALLSLPWLVDAGTVAEAEKFVNDGVLGRTLELRILRRAEIAIDRVGMRDGPFEAAMCMIDLLMVAPFQMAACSCLLAAARYLAAAKKLHASSTNGGSGPQGADFSPCCRLGKVLLHIVAQKADNLSPAASAHVYRQIIALQGTFMTSPSHIRIFMSSEDKTNDLQMLGKYMEKFVQLASLFPTLSRVNGRISDDAVSGMMFRELSLVAIDRVGERLGGLLTRKQWAYWRFEGVWFGWLTRDESADAAEDAASDTANAAALVNPANRQRHEAQRAQRVAQLTARRNKAFFDQERADALTEQMVASNITGRQVSSLIDCMKLPRTADGFLLPTTTPLKQSRPDVQFSSFDGVSIDLHTGAVTFRLSPASASKPALFGWGDLRSLVEVGAAPGVFSLDPVDDALPYHPFQALKFLPVSLRNTSVLATMFHTDYVMKFFSCGMEISSMAPFAQRPTTEGLLRRLPPAVATALNVNATKTAAGEDKAHRFWIEAGTLPYDEVRSTTTASITLGAQQMRVKKHLLARNRLTGALEDSEFDDPSDATAEAQFARNFTLYYDEIAKAFPEFGLLREMAKMLVGINFVRGLAEGVKLTVADLPSQEREIATKIENDLRTSIGSAITEFPSSTTMPAAELRQMLDENIARIRREHGSQFTYSIEQDVRGRFTTEIQSGYRDAVERRDREQVSQLATQLHVSESAVREMLTYRRFGSVAASVAARQVSDRRAELTAVLSGMRRAGFAFLDSAPPASPKGLLGHPSSHNPCEWVPAVFRASSTGTETGVSVYRVYGGVSLNPTMQREIVTPPATSANFLSSTALNAQRSNGFPDSTAARLDNMNAWNQRQFNQQKASNQTAALMQHGLFGNRTVNSPVVGPPTPLASTFANHSYRVRVLQEDTVVHRTFGGSANIDGSYWSRTQFATAEAAIEGLALNPAWNNSASWVATYTLPRGTAIIEGTAGPQGNLRGGANQVVINDSAVRRNMARAAQVNRNFVDWSD